MPPTVESPTRPDPRREVLNPPLDGVELVEKLTAHAGFRTEDSDADTLRTPESAVALLDCGRGDAGS